MNNGLEKFTIIIAAIAAVIMTFLTTNSNSALKDRITQLEMENKEYKMTEEYISAMIETEFTIKIGNKLITCTEIE